MPPLLDACRITRFPIGAELPVVQGSCGETALAADPTYCCEGSDDYEAGTRSTNGLTRHRGSCLRGRKKRRCNLEGRVT